MTSKKFENSITSLNGYKDINKPKEDRFSIDKYFVNNKENFITMLIMYKIMF